MKNPLSRIAKMLKTREPEEVTDSAIEFANFSLKQSVRTRHLIVAGLIVTNRVTEDNNFISIVCHSGAKPGIAKLLFKMLHGCPPEHFEK